MFEDLISEKRAPKTSSVGVNWCPNCKGSVFDVVDGVFIPGGFVEISVCKKCGTRRKVTYDVDLNIVNLQYGS